MRTSLSKRHPIRVAVIESDPLRFVGLRTCLSKLVFARYNDGTT